MLEPPGFVRVRNGAPAFAAKLRSGEPVTIVAFGTSLSYHRHYLERLVPTLSAAFDRDSIELEVVGLRGCSTTFAAHHVDRVLAAAPDMVLLEFSINDGLLERDDIERALQGIIERIRERFPACEFVSVQFAESGQAANGPTAAMRAHEALAERYALPSIDLAAVAESAVAHGACSWQGPQRALTTDGVHHTSLAEEIIGRPFADAFAGLLQGAVESRTVARPPRSVYYQARRVPISSLVRNREGWHCEPADGTRFGEEAAFVDTVARATRAGAMFRCVYRGTDAILWACTTGGLLRLTLNGMEIEINVPADRVPRFRDYRIGPLPDEAKTLIVEALTPDILLGDVFYFGDPA